MPNRRKQKRTYEKERPRESTADRVLAQTAAALERIEGGMGFQEAASAGPEARVLRNSLLTILRRQAVLDWVVHRFAERRIRPRLMRVLRWGVCQMLYLRGLAPAVAADACVRFVRRRYAASEAGFVNALLRRLSAETPERLLAAVEAEAPPHVRLALSEELWRKWRQRFSEEELADLARVLLEPAAVTVRLRAGAAAPALPCLAPAAAIPWAPETRMWRCLDPAAFFESPEYKRGDFYIQDPATLLAPRLLNVKPGETVADLCAAPGGKALLAAEGLAGLGNLVCLDRSRRRMRLVRENLAGVRRCGLVVGDAASPPLRPGRFDAVLLDVPCTNTGVVRRRPDVRWHFCLKTLRELVEIQRRVLASAAFLLKPRGRLVYSTCSLEPEENGEQVRRFLADSAGFELAEETALLPSPEHDGAYAALLVRG